MKSEVFSVRIEKEIKERMKKLRHIDWSEVVRAAIIETLEKEEGRNLAKAVLITEKIRKKAPKGWNSVEVIRYWRERRYGKCSD